MSEKIIDKVSRSTRHKEVIEIMHKGVDSKIKYNTKPLLDYIANLVEQAYHAGSAAIILGNIEVLVPSSTTNILADQYVKDKGLRV